MNYQDSNGVIISADELTAPTIVDTPTGERVGEAGQFLVCLPNSKPVLLDAATFTTSFIRVD